MSPITFVSAGLAAGAALAAIPVILHLFMKQTPKHVIFPALRLLRERNKRSRKKLRVKNWLLLLARMALVALMALALARPRLYSQTSLGDQEVETALALVFDTSLSMEYTVKGKDRLTEAKDYAQEILKKTHDNSQIFVIDSADPSPPLAMSPSAARKRIDGLALRPVTKPLNLSLGFAYAAVAQSDRPRHEVYVLTDLARSAWNVTQPVDGLAKAKQDKFGVATFVLRLTPKEVKDAAIVEVEARTPAGVATEGEPIEIRGKVRSTGPPVRRVVEFYLDGDKCAETPVDVPADGEVEVAFKTPRLAVGLHKGELHLGGGKDSLEFDDHRYLSFQVLPPFRVLVVSDVANDGEWAANALDPSALGNDQGRPFLVDRVLTRLLKDRIQTSLKDYSCVFLLNVAKLPDADWNALNSYVRQKGGGLVIALGNRVDHDQYNGDLTAPIMPGKLGKEHRPASQTSFGKADFSHALFSRYTKELDGELSSVPIYRYVETTPTPGARAVLSYQDGAPALLERTFSAGPKVGRVLLWTTPLSRRPEVNDKLSWNDFPVVGWSFFLLMNQTVPYLANTAAEQVNHEAGEDVLIAVDPTRRFTSYLVQGPGKRPADKFAPPTGDAPLVVETPQVVGQWVVSGSSPGGNVPLTGFSVNAPAAESLVVPLSNPELDALFQGKENYALADDSESLKRAEKIARIGHEIFPWIMALILVLVTAENFLANTFYRQKQTAA